MIPCHQVALIGLDLSSMRHVAKFVQNFRDKYDKVGRLGRNYHGVFVQVDVIINNAATGLGAGVRRETECVHCEY